MLSGSVCQMGQEAGLAGVEAMDKRAQETPSSAAHTVHSGEELAAEGSHVSPPLRLSIWGPALKGRSPNLLSPSAHQGWIPLHLETC